MLPGQAAHHLVTVLRTRAGARVALFNGRDGEWAARLTEAGRKAAELEVEDRLRPQAAEADLWLVFAPVKRAATGLIAEKATELGASRLVPLRTRRTVAGRVRTERLEAIAREAAEQCGRLSLPEIAEPVLLEALLARWPGGRRLFFCDEAGGAQPLLAAAIGEDGEAGGGRALLVGPEGGFEAVERAALWDHPACRPVSLGPTILRAETAAIAALAVLRAVQENAPGRLQ